MPDELLKDSEARCSGIPVLWLWEHRPAALRSFEELRRFSVNASVTLFVAVLVFVVVQATFEDTIVIEPISVPKVLEDRGYSGTVISQKLMDAVGRIDSEAATAKAKKDFGTNSRFAEASSIRLPSSSVSIQTVVTLLRNSFGIDGNRITGEITVDPSLETTKSPTFVLTLHLVKSGKRSSKVQPPGTLDKILELSARDIVEEFDAGVLASYLFEKNISDPLYDKNAVAEVDKLLDRLLGTADRETMPWLLNLRGLRLVDQGRYVEAQAFFKRATQVDPRFAPAYGNMGRTLAEGRLPGGRDSDEAIDLFRKATRLRPMSMVYNSWGNALLDKNEYDKAIAKYQSALEVDPQFAIAYENWGLALESKANASKKKTDYDEAIKKYERATEINPASASAYTGWGVALFERADAFGNKNDYDEAMVKFQRATEIDPRNAPAYITWGIALLGRADALGNKSDYDEAITKYHKATDLDPKNATAYNNWGVALEHKTDALGNKNDYDEAIAKYQKATDLDPRLATAYRNWGIVLEKQGRRSEALEKKGMADELERK